ncbi:beta-lactamase superfamily II metal-dependent hydrolase [Virgibacillus natechei]|uniref:Beta-lactamase superfamily II metal-dependent hydrolase n=1 Tax=Virgibacillus natechei TaxID=1216297 RepID=A0ABS4IIA1_9BACI|nr:ComEC/Rec2 family competence protein [Virgibacillus natechei]MBP1970598.1 beta-lactamase superfamily II metal-dependent hydrolase [Virgibacillus natechei]UZD14006.1 MBL fold metallo-hydrolase [Virgibacillus natechei]
MRSSKISLVFILFISIFTLQPAQIHSESQDEMQVHFIDVGQGDSILIQTPTNKTILIDGGPPETGKKVVSYLEKQQVEKIDLLIATHPDIDHIGGLPNVMKSFEVDQILDSGKLYTTKTYAKYLNQIRKQNIPINIAEEGELIKLDPMLTIRVLNSFEKDKNNNQSSIALKITYNDIDFVLMSDVEMDQEKEIIDKNELQAEILKVAHHGSNTSSSFEFLQEVNPQIAILTYSMDNDFGHPVDRVIKNLEKINATIYSTATFGNVVVTTDGDNYFITPQKSPIHNLEKSAS